MKNSRLIKPLLNAFLFSCAIVSCTSPHTPAVESLNTYEQLVIFFTQWREFQSPDVIDGVPDYSLKALEKQQAELGKWHKQLHSFDTTGWPIEHQIDWYLLLAEMNGLDFDHRVAKPWVRDPAFYVWFYSYPSDVPEREGPTIHNAIELPAYAQPLSDKDALDIANRLRRIGKLLDQAKINLTGNARDLWVASINSIRYQSVDLANFSKAVESIHPDLATAANEAVETSNQFAEWLTEESSKKTGPSGVGKENYTWYLRNVHLLPYSWESEKLLLERELSRAHSGLRLAEHRNRRLPKLEKAKNAEAYTKLLTDGVTEYMDFLEQSEFLTVKPYMKGAMLAQIQNFVPTNELRGFFDEIDYRDPMPMRAHHYHWIDKAREVTEPIESPIRRVPLLYNIFDSRAEGMATAMEELVLHAGLLESRPRAAELVYIMLAMRAARGLGGLYQHGLEMTLEESTHFASKWVPWGLLPADGATIQGEEQFYLQQPGYGSSYVIGKLDIDKLIAEYARQREGNFELKEFIDEFNTVGIIPMSLVHWQMTGDKSLLNAAMN